MSESSFEDEAVPPAVNETPDISSVIGSDKETATRSENGESSTNSDDRIVSRSVNKTVQRSKWTVLAVIFLTACGFSIATYFLLSKEETNSFETQFQDFAHEVAAIAHEEAASVFGLLTSMSITIESFALDKNINWPEILVPHFEHRGRENNKLSKALQLTLVPLVEAADKSTYETFARDNQQWVQDGVSASPELHVDHLGDAILVPPIPSYIYHNDNSTGLSVRAKQDSAGVDFGPGNYGPVWQQSPAPHDPSIVNFDLLSMEIFSRVYHGMWETRLPVLSEVTELEFLHGGAIKDDITHPHSFLLEPIYPKLDHTEVEDRDSVLGFIVAVLPWDAFLTNLLPAQIEGITVVLHNTCGDHFTYILNGATPIYVGEGDLHEKKFNYLGVETDFAPFLEHEFSEKHEHCEYDFRIYPTSEFEDEYRSNDPWIYAIVVFCVFAFTAGIFLGYDYLVQERQRRTLLKAKQTNAIVTALFPANVRDRLIKDAEEQIANKEKDLKSNFSIAARQTDQLKNFLDEEDQKVAQPYSTAPIADLFPHATVMFADIVGFTAWSSVREPTQVFTLLETVYHAFDLIAKRRRVFKVETVGDCYVAVAGLPDKRPDHPLVMARFAKECLVKMNQLTKQLEMQLGPDTGDLSMRIGLHSGPVTAGVLRGDKSRFQLFGDTVNTAARMESSGERNRIHLSSETTKLLMGFHKGHWVKPRNDLVAAKGKGVMQTYWLDPKLRSSVKSGGDGSTSKTSTAADDAKFISSGPKQQPTAPSADQKLQRLIGWNTDVLGRLIKQIVARRNAATKLGKLQKATDSQQDDKFPAQEQGKTVIDEVKEIIHLPEFDAEVAENQEDPGNVTLDEGVMDELRAFVGTICTLYRENPFHNFEHASHVTMSVVKLLSRINTADALAEKEDRDVLKLHDFTYGITSDPMTQFAVVFAALIHDVDHSGVPNATLVNENHAIARVYKNKSVAEQNSVDIAWELFMDSEYAGLRAAICQTKEEMNRFRELVVNSVMATDIVDKELKTLRNDRWEKAFSEQAPDESSTDATNRKATIVIEHLIQASDVAHTMQHWHIYRKWNEKFFHEMYLAFKAGRSDSDPVEFWYKGELGFFDFYIIPLAKKLKDCGVFGVSSDEYLNYAEKNRREWEAKGQEIVATLIKNHHKQYPELEPEDADKASMMRWKPSDDMVTVAE